MCIRDSLITSEVLFNVSFKFVIGSFVSLNQVSRTGLDVVHLFVLGFNFLEHPQLQPLFFVALIIVVEFAY